MTYIQLLEPKDQLVGGVIGTHTGPNICVIIVGNKLGFNIKRRT